MKRFSLFLLIAGLLGLALVWQWRDAGKKKRKRRRGRRGAIAVEVAPIKRGTIIAKAHYIGTLRPRYQYTVAPQIGGRLSRLKVRVGDRVKQKQLLAIIENHEVVQQVEQALAAVRVARAQLDEQSSRLQQARKEYNRNRSLSKKRLLAKSELEKSLSTYKIELAKLRVARAQLVQKRSVLKAARVRLSYTRIYARWAPRPLSLAKTRALMTAKETLDPLPGEPDANGSKKKKAKRRPPPRRRKAKPKKRKRRKKRSKKKRKKRSKKKSKKAKKEASSAFRMVGERFADEGSLVQPNTSLLTLLDIRSVIAVIYATEKDYIQLRLGQKAVARTYVYRKRRFTGRVVRIAPLLQESSRLARVEIEFPNLDLALKPGMFVRINIDLERADNATLIPRKALVRHKDKDGIFWFNPAERTVRFYPVLLGIKGPDLLQIKKPLLTGQVVTMGYHLLKDKAKVTLGSDAKATTKGKGAKGRRKGRKQGKGQRRRRAK